MALCVVDLFQIIHIKDHHGKRRLPVFIDQMIHMDFRFQIGMLVFDSGQGVDICLCLRLCKTPVVLLLPTNLNIDIIQADNQPRPFLLFHHSGF